MEESKSSALPLGDGASYKTVYHIFTQTTRAQTKKLSLLCAGRVFSLFVQAFPQRVLGQHRYPVLRQKLLDILPL